MLNKLRLLKGPPIRHKLPCIRQHRRILRFRFHPRRRLRRCNSLDCGFHLRGAAIADTASTCSSGFLPENVLLIEDFEDTATLRTVFMASQAAAGGTITRFHQFRFPKKLVNSNHYFLMTAAAGTPPSVIMRHFSILSGSGLSPCADSTSAFPLLEPRPSMRPKFHWTRFRFCTPRDQTRIKIPVLKLTHYPRTTGGIYRFGAGSSGMDASSSAPQACRLGKHRNSITTITFYVHSGCRYLAR